MEEVQISDEPAPVAHVQQDESTSQTLQVPREEHARVDNVEELVQTTISPQLFAQVASGDDVALPDANTQAEGDNVMALETLHAEPVIIASVTDLVPMSSHIDGPETFEVDAFDVANATLPLLPSLDDMPMPDAATSIIDSEPRVQAFAKLEFDDGQFYMNTWAVELGRDMRAAKNATEQEYQEPDQHNSSASRHRSNSSADGAQTSIKRREESRRTAGSVISETGGILNYGAEAPPKTSKSGRRKARSEGSVSRMMSRSNSLIGSLMERESVNPANLIVDRSANNVQPVNPQTHLPSPDECPLIPIHPPATDASATMGHRGISRRHVKIQYSFERRLFEMEVKGRNGAFVDEIYYGAGETAELRSRCYIQIGGVGIRFVLPNVADGETGAEPTLASEAVSAMSFDFEDGRGESVAIADMTDSSSEPPNSSDDNRRGRRRRQRSFDEESEQSDDSLPRTGGKKKHRNIKPTKGQQIPKIKLKLKTIRKATPEDDGSSQEQDSPSAEVDEEALKALGIDVPLALIPPRRKGPGRPPKNGFMSKREEASLKKQAREAAKAQAVADGTLPADTLTSPIDFSDKRKFLKKENNKEIHESIEGNEGTHSSLPPKLPKEKKPPKPPKSPSPFIDESTLTPEQLAKPQHSYVVMIHEALSNCPAGQMSLPQIYKAIERKYPYFRFKVTTPGWQSSIRHNLSQHPAFKKTETREGKGWMWCLDPDVSIEKEKRPRRPSPPPMTQQPYFPQGGHMYRPPFPYQSMPPPPTTTNGTATGQFSYTPAAGNTATASAARGPSGTAGSSADANAAYHSPYGGSGRPGGTQPSNGSPGSAVPTANPYLSAQKLHHQAQPSPLRTATSQTNARPGSGSNRVLTVSAQAWNAITRYKNTLMESLPMANRELLINTVIDKVLGKPVQDFTTLADRTAADAIEKPLVGLLQQIRDGEIQAQRQRIAQNGSQSGTPTAPPSVNGPPQNQARPVASSQGTTQTSSTPATQSSTVKPPPPTPQTPSSAPVASMTPQPPQSTTSVNAPTTHSSRAATPIASPITPVQASSPPTTSGTTAVSVNHDKEEASTIVVASSNQTEGQKPILSILSQLGSAPTADTTKATNKLSSKEPVPEEKTNGTRGRKRALDAEAEDTNSTTTGGKENSKPGLDGKERLRASKRLAM